MHYRLSLLLLAPLLCAPLACSNGGDAARTVTDTAVAAAEATAGDAAPVDTAVLAAADRGRIMGADTAPVWLLIISDFQCPFCRSWHEQTFPAVVQEYVTPGKVRLAYINLPIESHQNAKPAAEAAMCAGAQGRFWEVADGIFATQQRWAEMPIGEAVFDSIAGAQALDMPTWRECVADHDTAPIVEADAARAVQMGARSTPSFIVLRGQEAVRGFAGAFPIDTFRVALDSALAGVGSSTRR